MANRIKYMGLNLKNPVIVAAGPWSRNASSIQESIDAGAAAVATETITLDQSQKIYPRIYEQDGRLLNTTLYSTLPFEQWERQLLEIDKKDSYVICTIRGNTPSELKYVATRMERWGADALELCSYTPIGTKLEGINQDPNSVYEMLQAVVDTVQIPVSVRLPHHLACTKSFVKAVERSGAQGISAIEPMKALWGVNIEDQRSRVPTFGGYTGAHIFPITLSATATLAQLATTCQIASMGGIQRFENVLECIMMGASVTQLGSLVMLEGYEVIKKITDELEHWMHKHHFGSYEEIRGKALASLMSFEDIDPVPMRVCTTAKNDLPADWETKCETCRKACIMKAISADAEDGPVVDEALCDGCGFCAELAPDLFQMTVF